MCRSFALTQRHRDLIALAQLFHVRNSRPLKVAVSFGIDVLSAQDQRKNSIYYRFSHFFGWLICDDGQDVLALVPVEEWDYSHRADSMQYLWTQAENFLVTKIACFAGLFALICQPLKHEHPLCC
jgi:hypothetical protein